MTTGAKMRVYEIAREVGLPNKELIAKIRALGLEVNNHMSALDGDDVARLKQSLEKERIKNTETKRLSKTVLRRRSKGQTAPPEGEEAAPVVTEAAPEEEAAKKPARKAAKAAPATAKKGKNGAATAKAAARPASKAQVKEKAPAEPVVAEKAPEPVVEKPAEPKPKKAAAKPVAKEPPAVAVQEAQPQAPKAEAPAKAPPKEEAAPPPPAKAKSKPAAKPAPTEPEVDASKEPGSDARARFEAELQRARQQAKQREEERERAEKQKAEQQTEEPRADGRPEVGSVINLPVPRIKITERPAGGARQVPGQGNVRGRFAQQQNRGRRRDRKKPVRKGTGKQTQITTPAEHKRVIRMEDTIAMPEVAKAMGIKVGEVLRKLWGMGMTGTNINTTIDFETAQLLASEFGYEVQNVAFKEDDIFSQAEDSEEQLQARAPVVTVMGHVDHGKTSLLDYIRTSKVAAGEAGGITQHIGAYRVNAGEQYGDIVFIDTPGHAAFTEMRARGAQVTDIVILIVAADDGVMPQTVEALQHAKAAGVTIIVAVNKCDLPDAQPERIRQQLADHGLIPEEWGGETQYCDVSAATGEGVDKLLETISLNAELAELKANPDKPAVGAIIEAKLDRARGPMATVLVQEGTLRSGDIVVVGEHMGKVRAMLDSNGKNVAEAGPSVPVELLGLDGVPDAGERLNATTDEKRAKQVVEHRWQQKRKKELATTSKVSLENLMEKIQEGSAIELKVVLKADVHGSAEALREALVKQSTDKVGVNVISYGVGGITESDVNLAKAGGAIVVGFHVRPAGKAAKVAEKEGVEIKIYDIIYEAIDDVRAAMAGLLAPIRRENQVGSLEVRQTFTIPRRGVVAGCMVTSGRIERKSLVRVIRDAVQIYEGRIGSLRRFKDEASEVKEGFECGVMVDGFNDVREGDVLESYEIIEEAATL